MRWLPLNETLRPHQQRAYDNMNQHDCGQIVVPQTGKYGDRITKRLQSIVNYIFVEGIPPLSYV